MSRARGQASSRTTKEQRAKHTPEMPDIRLVFGPKKSRKNRGRACGGIFRGSFTLAAGYIMWLYPDFPTSKYNNVAVS
jgi:hypothetical protein